LARIVIIGGSGHVGTYLVPMLVEAGHHVVNVTRGQRAPYQPNAAWAKVETVQLDRTAAEADGSFGESVAALNGDIVIDMICFTLDSAKHLVGALKGRVQHFVHCGTIWVYGHNATVPATEDQPHNPFGDYGTQKAAIETFLLDEARRGSFPATVFRPGHIVGSGWVPLNPAGHFNVATYSQIARGETLVLPNFGLETVHHVHASDLARLIMAIIASRSTSVGEAFNAVSPQALNLRGYAEAMYRWFGREPNLTYLPFEAWKAGVSEDDAAATWEHIIRSPSHSMAKAQRLLGFVPRYSSLEAVQEAVRWLIDNGQLESGNVR
jgi:nucleoside-diphosphate-sugar epimerase